jgi:hypothetical protein
MILKPRPTFSKPKIEKRRQLEERREGRTGQNWKL